MSITISTLIEIAPHPERPTAPLHVRILDVTVADAPSLTVVERDFANVGPGRFRVDLVAPQLDPRRSYTLAAHWDAHGEGRVSKGDQITTAHVVVRGDGSTNPGIVRLTLV